MELKPSIELMHKVHIVHTLDDGNVKMLEELEETTTTFVSGTLISKILLHKRQMGDLTVVIKSVNGVKEDITKLPPDQMQAFCQEWNKYWKPRATNQEILEALEDENAVGA